MMCPICQKRKANRPCPAKAGSICSVCCATEREVTIDCPSRCEYLIASRQHEGERREIDWSTIPFANIRIAPQTMAGYEPFLSALFYVISTFAQDHRPLVDTDAVAAIIALAETYRTLSNGLYYEKPPDDRLQRELYETLKDGIAEYREEAAREPGFERVRDETVRDALIFLAQISGMKGNGRPRGRAFLDFLRAKSKLDGHKEPESVIVIP